MYVHVSCASGLVSKQASKLTRATDDAADLYLGHPVPHRHGAGPDQVGVVWCTPGSARSLADARSCRSRYHVPLQSVGIVLSLFGSYLGHHHGGREYPATVGYGHRQRLTSRCTVSWPRSSSCCSSRWVSTCLDLCCADPLSQQASLGIFLKLHIMETTVRPHIRRAHKVVGVLYPIVGWTQMLFGVATALNFCRGGNLGQCAAHYIMGSAFIAYAAILVIMLNVGGAWLKRTGFSQEMLDSTVITVWVSWRRVRWVGGHGRQHAARRARDARAHTPRVSSTRSPSTTAARGRTRTCSTP